MTVKINWRLVVWITVFYYIWFTAPYWWQQWQPRVECNPHVLASCEP